MQPSMFVSMYKVCMICICICIYKRYIYNLCMICMYKVCMVCMYGCDVSWPDGEFTAGCSWVICY